MMGINENETETISFGEEKKLTNESPYNQKHFDTFTTDERQTVHAHHMNVDSEIVLSQTHMLNFLFTFVV